MLKNLLRQHVAIVEFALYVHASKQSQVNDAFHNMLVQAFVTYRTSVESRFGRVQSILPNGASIYLNSIPIAIQVLHLMAIRSASR